MCEAHGCSILNMEPDYECPPDTFGACHMVGVSRELALTRLECSTSMRKDVAIMDRIVFDLTLMACI